MTEKSDLNVANMICELGIDSGRRIDPVDVPCAHVIHSGIDRGTIMRPRRVGRTQISGEAAGFAFGHIHDVHIGNNGATRAAARAGE